MTNLSQDTILASEPNLTSQIGHGMDNLFGIEIGGTKLQIVVGDSLGRIHTRERRRVNVKAGAQGIQCQIEKVLSALRARFDPAGIGVGFGGPVDWQTGHIHCSHQIKGWTDFPLGSWIRSLVNRPVRVENDANTAALAEAVCGIGKGANPVFYATLGSGIGGGLVVDETIYHGARPGEVEVGHLRLDRSGATLESLCSGWSVDARIRSLVKSAPHSTLSELATGAAGGEAKHLREALRQACPTARQVLSETATNLAFGLSHVVHLLHPQLIVLGGGLSLIGDPLVREVSRALESFLMDAFRPGPPLHCSALGEDAVPVGALLLGRSAASHPAGAHTP